MTTSAPKPEHGFTVTIPAAIAAEAGLEPSQPVDIAVLGNAIVVRPAGMTRTPLQDLLDQATEQNRHTRIESQL